MFGAQQSNELVFPDPWNFEDDKLLEELLADHVSSFGYNAPPPPPPPPPPGEDAAKKRQTGESSAATSAQGLTNYTGKEIKNNTKRQRKASAAISIQQNIDGSSGNGIKNKKAVHREIEKQRRQEMARLCNSLRSLLPPELIKGKRSLSDHMQEAVNYIKHTQNNIEDLNSHRDKLIKKLASKTTGSKNGSSNVGSTHSIVTDRSRDGVEILISSSLKQEEFPLSRVLAELLDNELNVVSYVSTRADDKSFHRIQIEANGLTTGAHLLMLQERLANVIDMA